MSSITFPAVSRRFVVASRALVRELFEETRADRLLHSLQVAGAFLRWDYSNQQDAT